MLIKTSESDSQILPMATFVVRCACGYGHDAFSETEADAILEVQARHACGETMTATTYDCREHQVTGKCRECAR